MDSFEWNKIFGAVLATLLLIVGVNILVDEFMTPHKSDKQGIEIAVDETPDPNGQDPAANLPPDWGTLLPAADLAQGEKVHRKCLQCHTFDKGGPNGIGPNLYDIVNAKSARLDGFAYSPGMKNKGNVWGYQELYEFIGNPKAYVPGTKMSFAGINKKADRISLIAWMRAQADSPAAVPEPAPAAPASPEGTTPGGTAPTGTAPEGAAPATPPVAPDGAQPAAPAGPEGASPAAAPGANAPAAAEPAPATPAPATPAPAQPAPAGSGR